MKLQTALRPRITATSLALLCGLLSPVCFPQQSPATEDNWAALDKRLKAQVLQLNVAIKVRLKSGLYAQLADLSPRMHYPVFATMPEDKGFRVVGYGTTFPVATSKQDHIYFLTNRHVIDFGDGMIQESRRFFAAARLYAESTRGFSDSETRYNQVMNVVNLCMKKNASDTEKQLYRATVDAIWDTYDNHLSTEADPLRANFTKYLSLSGITGESAYFLHPAGAGNTPAISAELYKISSNTLQTDLALLAVRPTAVKGIVPLQLDFGKQTEGKMVQAIGYPTSARTDKAPMYYAPTFSTGRVTRIIPGWVEFDATVSKGDSGGPLVNDRGKVIGVIVRRAIANDSGGARKNASSNGDSSGKFATAIDTTAVRLFAPELFRGHQ